MDRERQTDRIRIGWRFANKFNNQLAEANQFSCFVHRALRPTERDRERDGGSEAYT